VTIKATWKIQENSREFAFLVEEKIENVAFVQNNAPAFPMAPSHSGLGAVRPLTACAGLKAQR
jgi:hypothetical protein